MLLHVNRLQGVEIHLKCGWPHQFLIWSLTSRINCELLTSRWHWSSSCKTLLQIFLHTWYLQMTDSTKDEAMSTLPEIPIYQYTHIHMWFTNFPRFLKIFFCNTCRSTIFVNFVIWKLLRIIMVSFGMSWY